ncbi:MAG TPA: hypothetical protein VG186_16375 [Solirubrobacteraceae bacterium]|nr:hypothetical protein [Solirubrobacteraceae bacterium]
MGTRLIRILAASVLVALLGAASAHADGDPASDVLLAANVFYPYGPPVSASLQRALNAETAAAARAHFPIKVALIAAPTDLGVIPSVFGRPQAYADYLDQEISFSGKQPLLVVMAAGYGVQGLPAASSAAAGSLPKPAGTRTDDLARAAAVAVRELAAAAGQPIPAGLETRVPPAGHGSTALIVVLLAVGSVAGAAAILAVRNRRAQAR